MREITLEANAAGRRIGIAVARFNAEITEMLLAGCYKALLDAGVADDDIELVRVPGAWELPLACRTLIETGRFDAVIALGAVVRGETAHFEFISSECASGLQTLGLDSGVPVAFGVLTPENGDQARYRADPARGNKGREAALAALEMAALRDRLFDDEAAGGE
ncbi:MAG: 6,7-dimethyl-8-ribityllumazine synthase [Wenzhouxiangellaceae bacterium]|nr:6,7-dimethyl-8-ribityllumazine synthase [Wenzhouxiangellaceae bacterium]